MRVARERRLPCRVVDVEERVPVAGGDVDGPWVGLEEVLDGADVCARRHGEAPLTQSDYSLIFSSCG